MLKKIVFLTYHNWESKRKGGFHYFAKAACNAKYEAIFFSYPRPFINIFQNHEIYNRKALYKLIKGEQYCLDNGLLINITMPTFELHPRIAKYFNSKIKIFFKQLTFPSFKHFSDKYFNDAEVFVFESTESVLLFDKIKKKYPKSLIVYRPSDPIICDKNKLWLFEYEKKILKNADIVFLVNEYGLKKYKEEIADFDSCVNYKILTNGVDLKEYAKKHESPSEFKGKNKIALYVGALRIDWDVILEVAKRTPEINYFVICPETPPDYFLRDEKKINNLKFINGIKQEIVPSYVTNADLIIVPYPKNLYKTWVWGVTSKYYQAMCAKKPIVAYHDSEYLKDLGVVVTYNVNDFILAIQANINKGQVKYAIDIKSKDWGMLGDKFIREIELFEKRA